MAAKGDDEVDMEKEDYLFGGELMVDRFWTWADAILGIKQARGHFCIRPDQECTL